MTRAWEPCHLCEVELAGAIKDLQAPNRTEGGLYSRARILVRLHRQPLGLVEVALPATAEVLTDQIWKALANSINRHLVQDGQAALTHLTPRGVEPLEAPACQQQRLAAAAAAVPVTIVVCTRDRSALLARALDSLLPQTEQPNEILVVDNAPATSETADLVRDRYAGRVRYVLEPRPGLSFARNCGARWARGQAVAFFDDDAVADRDWLAELVAGLTDDVAVVSGQILPLELDTPAQLCFEDLGGYTSGFTALRHSQREPLQQALYPYTALRYGAGGNILYRRFVLAALGGFCPALGAGTPARSGEDIALYLKAQSRGLVLAYRPSAVIYHQHRRTWPELRRQALGYGIGFGAFVVQACCEHPAHLGSLARLLPMVLSALAGSRAQARRPGIARVPASLIGLERLGWLLGPLAYGISGLRTHLINWRLGRPPIWRSETETRIDSSARGTIE
jgi:glycosyltransferase involved in cell wall biosynthesis